MVRDRVVDEDAFTQDLLALRDTTVNAVPKKDYWHLRRIIWINRLFLLIGFGTAWIMPNPVSMFLIGIALTGMWTIVAHHVLHGGYDLISGVPKRYTSHVFAQGKRRYFDWPDWIYPPAWHYEHNVLHHFFVNESLDPDQMSYRLAAKTSVLSGNKSNYLKWLQIIVKISLWKCSYYAFNTMKALKEKKSYQQNSDFRECKAATYRDCIIPYVSYHFFVIPLLFLPLGWQACLFVLLNRLGAEVVTNWHTFFIIVTNHTGCDLLLQNKHFNNKAEFFMAQLTSSCNLTTGGFWCDYLHGYLNYQIEHHFFPNLPAAQYQRLQPLVKALCHQYTLPYVQESVFKRARKLFNVMLQKESMKFSLSFRQGCVTNDSSIS